MKIGITERGDAALDLSWKNKLPTVDGAVLITKNLTPIFIDAVNEAKTQGHKIIIHTTCTGWGGTNLEPNVPNYKTQLANLQKLILSGFPKEQCVLRIDPVFPSPAGLCRVGEVFAYADSIGLLPMRIRVSIYDEYSHVRQRLRNNGTEPLYNGSLYAPPYMMRQAEQSLKCLAEQYGVTLETCAEPKLACTAIQHMGCISEKDLNIMDITPDAAITHNPQNRKGCLCLSCKTELLENRHRCGHQCLYCFWKD